MDSFHKFCQFREMKQWMGDRPETCNVCGVEFSPKGQMGEFVFYDVHIPPPPREEQAYEAMAMAIIKLRQQDGDRRSPQEIVDYLIKGDGKFPGWAHWPKGIWGHICEACHTALTLGGKRPIQGQRYAVGGDMGKMGNA